MKLLAQLIAERHSFGLEAVLHTAHFSQLYELWVTQPYLTKSLSIGSQ